MRIWILFIVPFVLFSQEYGLKKLIEHADVHNQNITAKSLQTKAKLEEINAQKSAYWPTVDIGGTYSKVDPNSLVSPGETSTGYVNVALDLYDGGRKYALKRVKEFEYEASLFEKQAFQKSVSLDIVNRFYTVKKYQATLHSLYEKAKDLSEQIRRMKKLEGAGLAMQDEVDRLQAVYEDNRYSIETVKLAIVTGLENLSLQSGIEVKQLKKSFFEEPNNVSFEPFEGVKVLHANAKALEASANAVSSGNMPQLKVEHTYSRSKYDDLADSSFGSDIFPDETNTLQLSLNLRIFDGGKIKSEREALQYQKLALQSQSDHAVKEQRMNFRLAASQLKTIQAQLRSAKSGLRAAQSSYTTILKKYEEGLVDHVAYLDALSDKSAASSRVKEARYDYEIAKSIYYYYAGKDPKEFIR